jgi:protein-S-isoprenylcysteine O-methyltransferase Ste14
MASATAGVTRKAVLGFAQLAVVLGVALFVPAGTLRFPEAWGFLAVFLGCSLAITIYLAKKDPELLARRTRAGPLAEPGAKQKLIQALAGLIFLSTFVIPALERRVHRPHLPAFATVAGDTLVALGFFFVFRVFRENSFTAATIEVVDQQRVVDTGPYAALRHPMYLGSIVLVAGIPPALGSVFGLVVLPPFVAIIVWRLLEEERLLSRQLPGYSEYKKKTRFRLVPHVW